ncbi:hypothetical protein [Peribacillus sp. SCS-155]|uniref:hypothetical protein n=1 Tax=Peribacillus sedimenti TaxID=3115297 RepID=UPI00390678DF
MIFLPVAIQGVVYINYKGKAYWRGLLVSFLAWTIISFLLPRLLTTNEAYQIASDGLIAAPSLFLLLFATIVQLTRKWMSKKRR